MNYALAVVLAVMTCLWAAMAYYYFKRSGYRVGPEAALMIVMAAICAAMAGVVAAPELPG